MEKSVTYWSAVKIKIKISHRSKRWCNVYKLLTLGSQQLMSLCSCKNRPFTAAQQWGYTTNPQDYGLGLSQRLLDKVNKRRGALVFRGLTALHMKHSYKTRAGSDQEVWKSILYKTESCRRKRFVYVLRFTERNGHILTHKSSTSQWCHFIRTNQGPHS